MKENIQYKCENDNCENKVNAKLNEFLKKGVEPRKIKLALALCKLTKPLEAREVNLTLQGSDYGNFVIIDNLTEQKCMQLQKYCKALPVKDENGAIDKSKVAMRKMRVNSEAVVEIISSKTKRLEIITTDQK